MLSLKMLSRKKTWERKIHAQTENYIIHFPSLESNRISVCLGCVFQVEY